MSCHRRLDCLLIRLLWRKSKKTPKLRVTGLCDGSWPVTGEFPSQRAINAENVSIWWRQYDMPGWQPQWFVEEMSLGLNSWQKQSRHIDGLVQDCCNSIYKALELLQSCVKPSIFYTNHSCHCMFSRLDDMTTEYCSLLLQQTEPIYDQDTVNFGDNIANLANPIILQDISVMPVGVQLLD